MSASVKEMDLALDPTARELLVEAVQLLREATCPASCDNGAIHFQTSAPACCGNVKNNGECCGEYIEVPQVVDHSPCEWCAKRAGVLGRYQP